MNKEITVVGGQVRQEAPVAQGTEPFISKVAVAQGIGKTIRTVDNWMREGRIPFYKIGRSVCFKWSEVEAHLAENYRVCLRTK